MALDLGKLLRNVLTGGATYFKDQKEAKKKDRQARDLISDNTEMMQDLYDRDYGESALADLTSDPLMQAAQMNVMDRYRGLSETGYTDLDRQAIEQSLQQARRDEHGQRQGVMSAAARRGDVAGGNALLGALMAEQGGADRGSRESTDIALAGRDRALQALGAYGSMAGDMRAQSFNEQATRGGAVDAFNQWAAGQRSNDAGQLANARLGQSQAVQQQAAQLRSTPNLDAGVDALASYYSMGTVNGVSGGQPAAGGAQPASSALTNAGGIPMGHEARTHSTGRRTQRPPGTGGFGGAYG